MKDDRQSDKMSKSMLNILMEIGNSRKRRFDTRRIYDEKESVNAKLCKSCGGKCCKKCGCHFAPTDFKDLTFESLKQEIEKGYISIDIVDGEMFCQKGFFYILRVRNVGAPILDYGYQRSSCCLHTEKGCKLSYNERPTGGKMLIPMKTTVNGEDNLSCDQKYDIEQCCYDWEMYEDIISDLAKYFKGKDFPCKL